jgi:hypothetical protein
MASSSGRFVTKSAISFIWQSGLPVYNGRMTHLMLLRLRTLPIALALLGGASCWPAVASAQSAPQPDASQPAPPAADGTIRLTDEQRADILDNNTEDKAAAARGELTSSERADRGIHGEIGAMIGSYGTRGIYGTADIPLGDHAGATVSVESSRYGYRQR